MATTNKLVNVSCGMSSSLQGSIARMFEEGILVDVTLTCQDFIVKCHRLILASCSPYFADLLSKNSSPDLVICLVGIKKWHLRKILSFMYRGVIEGVTREQFEELHKVTKYLRIYGISNANYLETSKPESRSDDEPEPTLSVNTSCKGEASFPLMQKKRKQSQTSEPIDLVDLADTEESGSDTEVSPSSGSERVTIVVDCCDQKRSKLPIAKPFKKRPVVINDGKVGTVNRSQSSGIQEVAPDVRIEVADSRTTQIKNDTANFTKKMKMDRKGSCDGSNGSGLDPSLLLGLGLPLQSEERAKETVRATTTQLHSETEVKQVQKKRGRKPRMPSLFSRPNIAVCPPGIGIPTEHETVSDEVPPQDHRQQSILEGSSVNSIQDPPLALNIAEYEGLWINRLLHALYFILYGFNIEQTSLHTGIPVTYLTEYLIRHGSSSAYQPQQTGQQDGPRSNPIADHGPSRIYTLRELQEMAKRIYDQMLLVCYNMSILQGQSPSNPNGPQQN